MNSDYGEIVLTYGGDTMRVRLHELRLVLGMRDGRAIVLVRKGDMLFRIETETPVCAIFKRAVELRAQVFDA